jgi:hypothetical protein
MFQNRFYWAIGPSVLLIMVLIALGELQGVQPEATPQDGSQLQGLPAPTTVALIAASSSPVDVQRKTQPANDGIQLHNVTASSTTDLTGTSSAPIGIKPTPPLALAVLGIRTKTTGCVANQTLPDPACSPGAIINSDASVVCLAGYSQTVRDVPTSEKQEVFEEYGIDWSLRGGYEVDHIVSLELGGSNDISNLFPESYSIDYGARIKDRLEDHLHEQVCEHELPLSLAQEEIATDWVKYYMAWQSNSAPALSASAGTATGSVAATPSAAPTYYTSSYSSAKYYYPASCSSWKNLSPSYLAGFPSLEGLLAKYPNRTLSPQC